jgi:lysozyme family protein
LVEVLHGSGDASPEEISYIRNLTEDQAVHLYQRYFWDTNRLGELKDQLLADKIFDLCVNMGAPSAVRLLQEAANILAKPYQLHIDGKLGDRTLNLVNALNPVTLLRQLRTKAAERYRQIADGNPNLRSDLPIWLNRLAA